MYCDILKTNKDASIEEFAGVLGYSKIFFLEDFKKIGIFESIDYETDRKMVETKKIKILVNPHVNNFKDSLHFRAAGADHVLCKLAYKNNIFFGFSLDTLYNQVMIGRFRQNIKLCRKYGVKIVFFSFASSKNSMRGPMDIISLLRVFGMNGKEAKNALSWC